MAPPVGGAEASEQARGRVPPPLQPGRQAGRHPRHSAALMRRAAGPSAAVRPRSATLRCGRSAAPSALRAGSRLRRLRAGLPPGAVGGRWRGGVPPPGAWWFLAPARRLRVRCPPSGGAPPVCGCWFGLARPSGLRSLGVLPCLFLPPPSPPFPPVSSSPPPARLAPAPSWSAGPPALSRVWSPCPSSRPRSCRVLRRVRPVRRRLCFRPPVARRRVPPFRARLAPAAPPPGAPGPPRRRPGPPPPVPGPRAVGPVPGRRRSRRPLGPPAGWGPAVARPLFWGCCRVSLFSPPAWSLAPPASCPSPGCACRPPRAGCARPRPAWSPPAGRAWSRLARRFLAALAPLPAGPFAPARLVASCPVCGARCASRAVGPSSAWLLCPVCGACRLLAASRWLPAAGPVPVALPPAQLSLL